MSHHADALSHEDIQSLAALVVEFSWRRDHGQTLALPELVADTFEMELSGTPVVGRDAFVEWTISHADQERVARHVVTNLRFAPDGPGRAVGTSTTLTFIFDDENAPPATPFKVGEYNDTFVKDSEGWKFASRISTRFGPAPPPVPLS